MRLVVAALSSCAAVLPIWTDGFTLEAGSAHPSHRIRLFYLNADSKPNRRECMKQQLQSVKDQMRAAGATLSFSRFPKVSFASCYDVQSCMQERPECFPEQAVVTLERDASVLREVLGEWCTRLQLLDSARSNTSDWDYFLLLDDDLLIGEGFASTVIQFLQKRPSLWNLVAIDTAAASPHSEHALVADDAFADDLPLFSISATRNAYPGGHAWLVNTQYMQRFVNAYKEAPAMRVEDFVKAPRDLHVAMWAFEPRLLRKTAHISHSEKYAFHPACAAADPLPQQTDSYISDVVDDERTDDPLVSLAQSVVSVQEQARDQELVVLGMPGTSSRFVVSLIQEILEEQIGRRLCADEEGTGHCGGVSRETHISRIKEVDELLMTSHGRRLNATTAVVVVRHPFGLAQYMHSSTTSTSVKCSTAKNISAVVSSCSLAEHSEAATSFPLRAPCQSPDSPTGQCWLTSSLALPRSRHHLSRLGTLGWSALRTSRMCSARLSLCVTKT